MVSISDKNIAEASVVPDSLGRFGRFGGKYVPETLMPALSELEAAAANIAMIQLFKQN